MKILTVNNRTTWNLFHAVPRYIYKHDHLWIAPLERDIEKVFDPQANKAFKDGEAQCFVLLNDKGRAIGRIAAFIDHGRNKRNEHLQGAIGFFECINDEEAAGILFQKAESFLTDKGIKIIDGPVNFGERDKYWGLLVKGRYAPIYTEPYNPEYYISMFENNGFQPYEKVYTFKGEISDIPVEELRKKAKESKEKYNFRVETMNPRKLKKYANDLCIIYNDAFSKFPYFKPLKPKLIYNTFKQVKMVFDPKIACFVYKDDHPAGFCMLMPEINQFLKGAKGKINPFTLPGIIFKKFRPGKKILKGVSFGIHPDYQGKGVMATIVDALYDHANKNYSHLLLTTIRKLNKKMLKAVDHLKVEVDREHISYRKILDDKIAFEPLSFDAVLQG